MIQIDSKQIGTAVPIRDWVIAMEAAFRDTAQGKVEVPNRSHINRGENSFLMMPSFGEKYFSTKLVSLFPGNQKENKPVIYGTVILNDGHTGEPLAVLDGKKLTAMRTAAVGSVGIEYLAPKDAGTLGIIGLGVQGYHQALFACQQRPIRQLMILDRSKPIMSRFKDRITAVYKDVEVILCNSAIELCRASEIIITATGSVNPVVPGNERWWAGKTLIGIGSYKPEMQEFPDEIFSDLKQVFVDTMHGLVETGDLMKPVKKQIISKEQIIPIGNLILKKNTVKSGTQFFKSVGMAAFDLYAAQLVYNNLAES